MGNQPGLFEPPVPTKNEMARNTDPSTSHETAAIMVDRVPKIQAVVIAAYEKHGAMTARTAERLPEFGDYGFSTIRKRISELYQSGLLQECGVDRSGRAPCMIFGLREGSR